MDALHSWALTQVYLQSCHSPSFCFTARFLYSVLISQGSSFGLIIPIGINRTAAAILASAASFAEQQCGLLDKAGAGSQEHRTPAQLLPGASAEGSLQPIGVFTDTRGMSQLGIS